MSSTQAFVSVISDYDSGMIDSNYYCNPFGPVMMQEDYQYNFTFDEWRSRHPAWDANPTFAIGRLGH